MNLFPETRLRRRLPFNADEHQITGAQWFSEGPPEKGAPEIVREDKMLVKELTKLQGRITGQHQRAEALRTGVSITPISQT